MRAEIVRIVAKTYKMIMTHVGVPADSGGAGGWQQAIEKLAARLAVSCRSSQKPG